MLAEIIPKIAGFEKGKENNKYKHRCSNASIGERCIRQAVYNALGYEAKPFGDRFSLVVDDSSWHEELTADWLRKSGYKIDLGQMEIVPFKINDRNLIGKIDGILTDLTGNDYLYEHKAISHFTFAKYENGNQYPSDNICQVVCYLVGLYYVMGKYIPAILLIKNKNTSNYLEYLIEYDDQTDIVKCKLQTLSYEGNRLGAVIEKNEFFIENVLERIKARFELIDEYVSKKEIPQRQYSIEDWQCSYCRYAETCWQGYEEEVKENKTAKVKDFDVELVEYANLTEYVKDKLKSAKEAEKRIEQIEENIKSFMIKNEYQALDTLTNKIILKYGKSNRLDKNLLPLDIIKSATKTSPKIDIKILPKKEKKK